MTQSQFNTAWGGLILITLYGGLIHMGMRASWHAIAANPWHWLVYQPLAMLQYVFSTQR